VEKRYLSHYKGRKRKKSKKKEWRKEREGGVFGDNRRLHLISDLG